VARGRGGEERGELRRGARSLPAARRAPAGRRRGVSGALHDLCRADPVWADRYEGWTELGRGGSATVVRTHSKVAGQDIALKVFLRTAAEDWQRFQAEVQNAQALVSPCLVRT